MNNIKLVVVTIVLAFITTPFSAFSKATPDKKNCDFYAQKEKEAQCSKTKYDYLINYGEKYCSEFSKLKKKKKSNKKLKSWISSTLLCLQEMIFVNKKRTKPCKQLESFAFDSHPICYKQYDVCFLGVDNLWKIIRTVEIVDYLSVNAVIQVDNILFSCLAEYAKSITAYTLHRFSASKIGKEIEKKKIISDIIRMSPDNFIGANKYFEFIIPFITMEFSSKKMKSITNSYKAMKVSKYRPYAKFSFSGQVDLAQPSTVEVSLQRLRNAKIAGELFINASHSRTIQI